MYKFPKMFSIFVTKQTSKFCGTNSELSHFDDLVETFCPSCVKEDELPKHMKRCRDPKWRAIWCTSVQELTSWVGATTSNLILCNITKRYLKGQREVTMMGCFEWNAYETHRMLACTHDKLGWYKLCAERFFNSSWRWWQLCFLGGHE